MIESGITSRMSGVLENSGHHPSPQDYRLLTTDPSQLQEDLPGELQSLSWLTSVDVPRLQQMADGRGGGGGDFNGPSQGQGGSLLEQQTAQLNSMTMAGGQGAMIHLQSNMQHSPLGINVITAHSGNMSPFSMNGQPSPVYQCPASAYQPTAQQVFTLTQASQQCSPAGFYSNVSFNNQNLFTQPRLAPQNQDLQPKSFPKPIYSYSCLIAMALKNSKTGSLPVSEIYSFMKEHFPYFKTAPDGWKNSVRHNLSLNKCFEKVENKMSGSSRKGCLWALNPAKIDKMEEEMQKWKRKDLPAIRRSMANPDELDKLITDRPESCRRKPMDPGMTRLPSCPSGLTLPVPGQMQPQPVVTLSLQCLPMHQHHQLHAQLQANAQARLASVSPAHKPPLHTVPDLSHSPLSTEHPGKQPHDFYSLHGDVNAEVDALDPSIMDFALQGNLWEEMKDDSFNLEALGTFSNSPLRLSDCDLGAMTGSLPPVSSGGSMPFSDLQATGLFSSYAALDALSSQYMGTPGNSKPITALL
ncbi:forkhead box protein N4 isoform X1 [Salvelinus sp. IW2-2015]|uniref:forkhead box protein N4 isoform X1 n=1 Tax=Salvelinus sp. IW2-2015 TaxID=2691554 RepID=UPI000CDF7CEB|nr:forkhead box protein N4-like isoform X1 [Salvelinus alpinus]